MRVFPELGGCELEEITNVEGATLAAPNDFYRFRHLAVFGADGQASRATDRVQRPLLASVATYDTRSMAGALTRAPVFMCAGGPRSAPVSERRQKL